MCCLRILSVFCFFIFHADSLPRIHSIEGDVRKPFEVTLDKNNEYIIYYRIENSINPFRVKVSSSNADQENPVMVVVRQESEVISWKVPMSELTSKNHENFYNESARTLCYINTNQINLKRSLSKDSYQEFTIALSSYCDVGTDVFVEIEEEKKFHVTNGESATLSVSPSQSRFVYYKFPDNESDTVTIDVVSDDDVCLMISIQESQCPVFDQNEDIKFRGKYQTVLKKAGLTINKNDFNNGFFLVFVVLPDNSACITEFSSLLSKENSEYTYIEQNSDTTSNVNFTIRNNLNKNEYLNVTLYTLGAIAIFYIISFVMILVFRQYGSMKRLRKSTVCLELKEEHFDDQKLRSEEEIEHILKAESLDVRLLTKYPSKDKQNSFNYLWHIICIAIFYGIPVVQLVITYQRIVNSTGNQDMCYYNFLCAHPLFGFSDFNHIFSNVGYIFMGLLFLFASFYRHNVVPFRFEVGIPVHYGLFYAMGIALIIEGMLSACYHICPSQSNFQFDTSFMYIMVVLCMVKLYQNRHPDFNATSYQTFTVLGFGILMATIGILYGSLPMWVVFYVSYFVFCLYLSFKIYFLTYVIQGFQIIRRSFYENGLVEKTFRPVKKARFIVLLLVNLTNFAISIFGLILYTKGSNDFATFILALLMANAGLHIIFYCFMKLVHGERICNEAIVYLILSIVCWVFATIYFVDASAIWAVTPAESRERNQHCILMEYYDNHDVWHLLSAPALYFTFMFLMCLDDDIIEKNQEQIPVF